LVADVAPSTGTSCTFYRPRPASGTRRLGGHQAGKCEGESPGSAWAAPGLSLSLRPRSVDRWARAYQPTTPPGEAADHATDRRAQPAEVGGVDEGTHQGGGSPRWEGGACHGLTPVQVSRPCPGRQGEHARNRPDGVPDQCPSHCGLLRVDLPASPRGGN